MTKAQELHLNKIKNQFLKEVDKKYRAGQKEYGSNLWDMTPLDSIRNAKEEAVDCYVYLYSLEMKILEYFEAHQAPPPPTKTRKTAK